MGHSPHPLFLVALVMVVSVVPHIVEARCSSGHFSYWPSSSESLPANGRVALEGYGTKQDFVRTIASRRPRLLSGKRSIPLRVVEIQEGAHRITQAILQPHSPLEVGRRYVLSARGQARFSMGGRPAAWTVMAADNTAPVWSGAPVVGASSYRPLGCGPSIFVHLGVSFTESSPSRVRVHLEPLLGGSARTYDVSPADGHVAVGHGMCSGPFRLSPGARYRVTLAAIDAAGNATPSPGGPLTIVGPSAP